MKHHLHKLILCMILSCISSSAFATIYYVNASAAGTGTGTSWQNAFLTVEAGLQAAIVGDEVWVAAGVYHHPGGTYSIPNGVKVYGSFAGTETAVGQRNIALNQTTLNGEIGGTPATNDNSAVVVNMSNVSNLTRFDGFRIINGYNNGSDIEDGGSAIRLSNSSPTIENCVFMVNYSKIRGGAVHIRLNGTPTFINCEWANNTTGNYTTSNGGGLFINSGTVKLIGCKFKDNSTQGTGGAISAYGGTVIMDRCYVSGNVADDGAGGIYVGDNATFNVYNSLFVGNVCNGAPGAAVYINPTFNENEHKFINVTVANNKSNSSGVSTAFHVNSLTTVKNSIFWGNDTTYQVYCLPPTIQPLLDYCIIQGTYPDTGAVGVTNQNPLFVTPGDVELAPFNHEGLDYSVTALSTAINTGSNTQVSTTYNKDILGLDRIQVTTVDKGAYESAFATVPQGVTVAVQGNASNTITTIGGTLQLVATVTPAGSNQDVTWSVVSGTAATVSATGVVTAVANGSVTVRATSVANNTVYGQKQVIVNTTVNGLEDVSKTAFILYPNPTTGVVNIESAKNISKVIVSNLSGQKVFESAKSTADLTAAAPGVYFVSITFEDNSTAVQKIVKQ